VEDVEGPPRRVAAFFRRDTLNREHCQEPQNFYVTDGEQAGFLICSMHVGPWNVTPAVMLPTMTSEKIVPVILIVEDEASVRMSAVGMLEDAGFRMIEAANNDEALELLSADSDVQLLFTDINMPGTIDGLALARQVHDRWPHVGIMVASGMKLPHPEELPEGSRFERKPYNPDTVVRHARELTSA
jgi:CheY-like chemotaxis protein